MAVAFVNKIQNGSGVDATSHTTASFTPVAGRLYLVAHVVRNGASTDPTQPTISFSGTGLTLTAVNSVVFDNSSTSRRRVTVYSGVATGSPTAGTITFSYAGVTMTSAEWAVDEATGADTANPVVQSVTNFDPGTTATTLTATLAAFSSASNATYGAGGCGQTLNTGAAGSGFTALANGSFDAEAGSIILTEYTASNDTTVDMSFTSTGAEIGVIGVEIKAAAVAAAASASTFLLMGV